MVTDWDRYFNQEKHNYRGNETSFQYACNCAKSLDEVSGLGAVYMEAATDEIHRSNGDATKRIRELFNATLDAENPEEYLLNAL